MPSCRNWAEFPSQRLLRLSILIVFVIATGLSIGPVMRETDQASILDGALRIAQGHPIHKANFYNYDKQYLTYAFTGLLLKLGRSVRIFPGSPSIPSCSGEIQLHGSTLSED